MRIIKFNINMPVFEGPDDRTVISFEIEDGYTSIGDEAFMGCSGLESVVIPKSVTNIGRGAFGRCSSLSKVIIPESVTTIGDEAFYDCLILRIVVIPNTVTNIGEYAFARCSSLSNVVIPDSVTEIGWKAFEDCTSLTSVVIPGSVTHLGFSAFSGCSSLAEMSFLARDIRIDGNSSLNMTGLKRVLVYPSRVDEFQAFFNSPRWSNRGGQHVEVLPLPDTVMKQLQHRKFIHMSNTNTKKYTLNQRDWIATFILAAYAASRVEHRLPHLPPELVRMILEMVRRADADNEKTVNTTNLIEML